MHIRRSQVLPLLLLLSSTSGSPVFPDRASPPRAAPLESFLSLKDREVVGRFGSGFEDGGCRCYSTGAKRYLTLCTEEEPDFPAVWRASFGDRPECSGSSPSKVMLKNVVSSKGLAIGNSIKRVRELHGVPTGIRRADSLDGGPLSADVHRKLGGYEESFACGTPEACSVLSVFLRGDTVSAISAWVADE